MREFVVGVDAGGSSTTVALADARDGEVVRVRSAPAANVARVGAAGAAVTLAEAIVALLERDAPLAIAVGAAGAWEAHQREALRAALAARFPAIRLAVTHDAVPALRAGVPTGDGLVLIAGTGSLAYAELGERCARSGGLGYALGDEGSGYAIGAAAVRLALRALDGRGVRDALVEAVLEAIGAAGADDARTALARLQRVDQVATVAATAALVIARAGEGDRAAAKIVQAAALDLFDLVRAVMRAVDAGTQELPLVLAGGLLRSNTMLSFLLETRIANEFAQLHLVKDVPEPYVGALAAARALLDR